MFTWNIHHPTYHHLLHNFFTSLKTHPLQPWHTTTHQCHFPLNWHMKMNRVETKGEVVRKPVELHSTTTTKSLALFLPFQMLSTGPNEKQNARKCTKTGPHVPKRMQVHGTDLHSHHWHCPVAIQPIHQPQYKTSHVKAQ
jgi:hypothetical protein